MNIQYQRNIFYIRFKPWGHVFRLIAPRDSTISSTSTIGGGIIFCHPHNTFINAKSIGENFKVYHNVTIGNNNGGLPTIGNNVSVYTNAVIVGDIKIGNDVNIGAGCVVTKDVPDNCTIIGNPAIVIKRNGVKVNENL